MTLILGFLYCLPYYGLAQTAVQSGAVMWRVAGEEGGFM